MIVTFQHKETFDVFSKLPESYLWLLCTDTAFYLTADKHTNTDISTMSETGRCIIDQGDVLVWLQSITLLSFNSCL